MNKSLFKLTPLAAIIGIISSSMAINSMADEQTEIEEVVAYGSPIYDSQAAAVDAKRSAGNTLDIISADTIGRFPDQNLADSIGRLPGVAIERDQGQARYINFRGAPFRYTKIAIDGIDVPGAENGRVPRFDSFPSTITSRIEANKAVLPSMPGDTISGYVNVITFDPFSKEGLSLAADIGAGKQELGDGDIEKYSLRAGWSNDSIGIVAFGSHNKRDQITDNREYDLEKNDAGELVVNSLEYRNYKVQREDNAWGGRVEYRGDDVLKRVYFNTLYSEFIDNEERNQFVFDFLSPVAGVKADDQAVSISRLLEDGTYKNSTRTHTLGAEFQTNNWKLMPSVTLTKTKFDMFLPIPSSVGGGVSDGVTASYDVSDIEDPILTLSSPLAGINYAATIGIPYTQLLDNEETKLRFDAETPIMVMGNDATLSLGTQYDQRTARGHVASFALDTTGIASLDINSFNTGKTWSSNTTNSIDGTYYDNAGVLDAWQATGALNNQTIADSDKIQIDESVLAAYGMADIRTTWGSVIAGARVERTDYSSEGTIEGRKIKEEDNFVNVLPAVHINVDLAEDVKWRNSVTTGVSRPNYDEWRAAVAVSASDKTARGGNPQLNAEESVGFDTSVEWYFAPASLISAAAFYRTIDNVIYADSTTVDGGRYLSSAAGEEWTYTGFVNGSDGKLQGLELNALVSLREWIDGPLGGFGVSTNVTLLDSDFKTASKETKQLPGTSDTVFNASVFYEAGGVSARVNYQYRDEWVSPIEDPDEVWGEQQRVDMSVSYDLPWEMDGGYASVYVNANNLTNETDNRYAENGTINQSESYGRSYLAGVRINY